MAFKKPQGLGADKQTVLKELNQLVHRSKMQWALIEELCELKESRDIYLPELTVAFKNYSHLLGTTHKIKLDFAWDAATSEQGSVEKASCGQNRIGANDASTPKSKLTPLARPDPPKTINKSNSTICTRAPKLPKYAAKANLARLIRIFCKGDCVRGRWAEMDADYPGQEVLRCSQVGDFRATCLKCGRTALDCYKWLQ